MLRADWELHLLRHGPTGPQGSRKSQQHSLLWGNNGNGAQWIGFLSVKASTTVVSKPLPLTFCCHHIPHLSKASRLPICFLKIESHPSRLFSTMTFHFHCSMGLLSQHWCPPQSAFHLSPLAHPGLSHPSACSCSSALCWIFFPHPSAFLNSAYTSRPYSWVAKEKGMSLTSDWLGFKFNLG